jgi:hypothetical protein
MWNQKGATIKATWFLLNNISVFHVPYYVMQHAFNVIAIHIKMTWNRNSDETMVDSKLTAPEFNHSFDS